MDRRLIKHLLWDDLVVYVKVAWARVVKYVKVSAYSAEAPPRRA